MDSHARPDLTAKVDVPELTVGKLRDFLAWVVANGADDTSGVWITEVGEIVGTDLVIEVDCVIPDSKVGGR